MPRAKNIRPTLAKPRYNLGVSGRRIAVALDGEYAWADLDGRMVRFSVEVNANGPYLAVRSAHRLSIDAGHKGELRLKVKGADDE